jgi:cytochrome c556
MKIRLLLLVAVCALAPGRAIYAADEKETELGLKMEKAGGAFRALGRQVNDPAKNADSLQRLAVIKDVLTAGLKLEPAKKAEIPAAEQKKFIADYQAEMKRFITLVEKTEAALKANNNDEAVKLVATMRDDQKKAHKQFKKDDKKK